MSIAGVTIDGFTLFAAGTVLLVALMFSPTRALMGEALRLAAKGIFAVLKSIFAASHEGGKRLIDAHKIWFANWRPRIMVLPNLDTPKSTRRKY